MSDISFFVTGIVLLIVFANSDYNFFETHDHFFMIFWKELLYSKSYG